MTINGRGSSEYPAQQPARPTVISQAYADLLAVQKAQQEHNDQLQRNAAFFSQDGIRSALNSFADSPQALSVDEIEQRVHQLVAQKKADLDAELAALSPPGDTARELRNTRARDRVLRKLDAAKDSSTVVNAARQEFEQASPEELGVLLQEVPSYLESRGAPTNWIPKVVQQKVPDVAQAQTRVHNAQQAQLMVHQAAGMVKRGIRDGRPPTQLDMLNPSRFDPDRQ